MDKIKEVWIVDDDHIFRLFLKTILVKSEEFETINAFENGLLAINELKSRIKSNTMPPSIIFLDINMPILNGWEFMEAYAEIKDAVKSKLEIYISSSSIDKYDLDKAKNDGNIKDFLTKPLKLDTVKMVAQNYKDS